MRIKNPPLALTLFFLIRGLEKDFRSAATCRLCREARASADAYLGATPDQLRVIRALDDIVEAQASILESMLYDIGFI
jgi:hypothetical protein